MSQSSGSICKGAWMDNASAKPTNPQILQSSATTCSSAGGHN